MKQLLILLSVLSTGYAWGQGGRITFTHKGGAGQQVRVLSPVEGRFFWGDIRTEMLDSTGTFVLENRIATPGAFTFYFNGSYTLYVRPGQSYVLSINPEDDANPLRVEAADAEGQIKLNNVGNEFYQSVGLRLHKADTTFMNNSARVRAALDSTIQVFGALNEDGRIDTGFLRFAINKSKAYYAAVLGATLLPQTQRLILDADSAGYQEEPVSTMELRWKGLGDICDASDPENIGSGEYIEYADLYNMWYLGYIKGTKEGRFRKFETADAYDRFQYENIRRHYDGPIAEYLCASHLAYLMIEEKFKPGIPSEYEAFTKQFPSSIYTGYLRTGLKRLLAYQNRAKEDFTPLQRFVAGHDTVNTFADLVDRFKDQTIFVDLWATWCGPCKAEFAFNDELRVFLDIEGIIPVYISIDGDQDEQRWKDMIKYYDLQGYHVRANPKLTADLRHLFGTDGTLAIPRYVLIENGTVVGPRMKSPSEKDSLYRQIESYLRRRSGLTSNMPQTR